MTRRNRKRYSKDDFVLAIVCRMLRDKEWGPKIREFINGVEAGEKKLADEDVLHFSRMMASFINRAQQRFLGGRETLAECAKKYLDSAVAGARERLFIEIGMECFKRYHWFLLDERGKGKLAGFEKYGTDFNLIVDIARKFMQKSMHEKGHFKAKSWRAGKVVIVNSRETRLHELIKREKKAKNILILHRNNETNIEGVSLEKFGEGLKMILGHFGVMDETEFEAKITLITMHKSKGLEAEVVIILEADEEVIPKMHPDTILYSMFGETEKVALDDQKRLFYVAMTRAKKRLYIIHNAKEGKGFIPYLGRNVEKLEK